MISSHWPAAPRPRRGTRRRRSRRARSTWSSAFVGRMRQPRVGGRGRRAARPARRARSTSSTASPARSRVSVPSTCQCRASCRCAAACFLREREPGLVGARRLDAAEGRDRGATMHGVDGEDDAEEREQPDQHRARRSCARAFVRGAACIMSTPSGSEEVVARPRRARRSSTSVMWNSDRRSRRRRRVAVVGHQHAHLARLVGADRRSTLAAVGARRHADDSIERCRQAVDADG